MAFTVPPLGTSGASVMGKPKRDRGVRVGDRVRIVTPAFFARCGYPMAVTIEADRIRRDRGDAIAMFLAAEGVRADPHGGTVTAVGKVARALAYELCRQANWGGRDRRIHTRDIPALAGAQTVVRSVRFVKTGEYTPGCTRGGYDGYDYAPAYLSDERSHRIIGTDLEAWVGDEPLSGLEIEAANVELLSEAAG